MRTLFELLRLMRPYQWVKNSFVFTGLLFGHAWQDIHVATQVAIAFAAFCLVSSAIYTFNDIVDLEHDRFHPTKSLRPLAVGTVSTPAALMFAPPLGMLGIWLAYLASPGVLAILTAYAVMNVAYALLLKHVVILDVFVIAAGFMLRILAGTVGVGISPSQWLLLCGLMATLFMVFIKRRAEITALPGIETSHREVLEHYSPLLLDKMIGITAAGLIMSYSLYTMNPDTIRIHNTSHLIYTVPFVMYGVFRYIYLLYHHSLGGDPSRDLVNDHHILFVAGGWLVTTIWLIA